MSFYRPVLAFDALFVAVLTYFYLDGLQYPGSRSASGLWLLIIGVPVAAIIAAWQLKAKGRLKSANALLGIVAMPPLLFVIYFGAIMISQPTWR